MPLYDGIVRKTFAEALVYILYVVGLEVFELDVSYVGKDAVDVDMAAVDGIWTEVGILVPTQEIFPHRLISSERQYPLFLLQPDSTQFLLYSFACLGIGSPPPPSAIIESHPNLPLVEVSTVLLSDRTLMV